jgi:hypothetical protein
LNGPKIIFVNRVYWPSKAATAQLLTDLAEGLAMSGHDVHVIASGEEGNSHQGVTIHRTGGEASHGGMRSRVANYFGFLRAARKILPRIATRGDIVILKTDPPLLGAALCAPARSLGAKVVQWIQDIYPEILPAHYGPWLSPFIWPLRAWRNRAWRRSAACVTVGPDMRFALSAAGVDATAIHVQPNWAPRELDTPASADDIARLRRSWGLEGKFIVGYSGNLGRVHEFATLLETATALRDDANIAFVFVGNGPRWAELQVGVASRGLPNVRFLPPVARADLAASLAATDIQAVTLRPGFERWVNPSKLAGILAAGRPALFVGPPDCAIAKQLTATGAGFTIAPGDAAGCVAAIRRLQLEANSATARQAARALYEAEYRFGDQLSAWDRLLRALSKQ